MEYDGTLALLAGDAFPTVITSAIKAHWQNERPKVALLKLSHHGSKGNTDKELLKAIECNRFLVSTSGGKYKHPDHVTIARILNNSRDPEIFFNYDQPQTTNWQHCPEGWPCCKANYPVGDEQFVRVELTANLP